MASEDTHNTTTMDTVLTGLKTRLSDQLRVMKYEPWFIFLQGLTKKTWAAVVVGSLALSLIVLMLVLTATALPGCQTVTGVQDSSCVFPFSYKGSLYTECTTVDNNGTEWCSTKTDHAGEHTQGNWGNCGEGCKAGCRTVSGPDEGALCAFPFTWHGKVYRQCTSSHNDGILWCSTQTDWQGNYVDDKWGHCSDSCSGCGTLEEDSCIFPFTYHGTSYTECTTQDNNGTLWCALGTDKGGNWRSKEHTWGNCGAGCTVGCHTYSGVPCVFPFKNNGTQHRECVKEENHSSDLRWCATHVKDGDMVEGMWEYCTASCSFS